MGRKLSAVFFVGLWITYISVASLYQLGIIDFQIVEPPAWYVCTKTPEDQVCINYCANLDENTVDPACKKEDQEAEDQEADDQTPEDPAPE